MKRALLFLTSLIITISVSAQDRSIQWEQPEVVPEKLYRKNRRVLRFAGVTKRGTQVRVRDNKVKMMYSDGAMRWARIPKKNRVQFPVIASETGYFSFELYLPTVAVEIPLEVFRNGRWRPYKFSFDVPSYGEAENFEFEQDRFKTKDEEEPVEDFLADYDRSQDRGQIVNGGGEWKSWVTKKFLAWAGFGFNYVNVSQTENSSTPSSVTQPLGDLTDFGFPSWEIGGEFRWNAQWKIDFSYLSKNYTVESDGNYTLQNNDFSWNELRLNVSYYPMSLEKSGYRFGLKGGLHRHELPYLKPTGPTDYRIFSNAVTFLALGGNYETMNKGGWNFDTSVMFLYPALVGNGFDLESGYGLYVGASLMKELIPAFYVGGKIDIHWIDAEIEFNAQNVRFSVDSNLWNVSPSLVLKTEF